MDLFERYRAATEPSSSRLSRVRARVRVRPAGVRPEWPRQVVLGAGLLAATGLFLATRPAAGIPSQTLESPASPTLMSISRNVGVRFNGKGQITGTEEEPHIRWEAGELSVEVTPHRGIQLDVTTREATVKVIGTAFTVNRDALGTAVSVRHGKVEVACVGQAPSYLEAGAKTTCLPTSPAGLLARGRALQDAGAPAAMVLETAERGLAASHDPGPVRSELQVLQLQALADSGRSADALAAADVYLDGADTTRHDEVLRFAATVAMNDGGCAAAVPYLRPLVHPQGLAADFMALADCSDDPRESRGILQRALSRTTSAVERAAIEGRLMPMAAAP